MMKMLGSKRGHSFKCLVLSPIRAIVAFAKKTAGYLLLIVISFIRRCPILIRVFGILRRCPGVDNILFRLKQMPEYKVSLFSTLVFSKNSSEDSSIFGADLTQLTITARRVYAQLEEALIENKGKSD